MFYFKNTLGIETHSYCKLVENRLFVKTTVQYCAKVLQQAHANALLVADEKIIF